LSEILESNGYAKRWRIEDGGKRIRSEMKAKVKRQMAKGDRLKTQGERTKANLKREEVKALRQNKKIKNERAEEKTERRRVDTPAPFDPVIGQANSI